MTAVTVRFVYAAPAEAGPHAGAPGFVELGVGKTAAASGMAGLLADARPSLIVAFGVAGAYMPFGHSLGVGGVVVVGSEVLADEGVATEDGFVDLGALGLGDPSPLLPDPAATDRVAALLGEPPRVPAATVSTCSGNDALATELATRTGAAIETMEGAAIAWVCARHDVPWVGVRTISNRTGDRARGGWDLAKATAKLHAAIAILRAELLP